MRLKTKEEIEEETKQILSGGYWGGKYTFEKHAKEFQQIPQKDQSERTKIGKQLYDQIKNNRDMKLFELSDLILEGADLEYKEPIKGNFALLVCARK